MDKKTRYTRDDRKHIVELIENLKNNDDYVTIFEILTDDPANSYMTNSNGVFLNLSAVSDSTLDRISKFLVKISKRKTSNIEVDVDVIPVTSSVKSNRTYKLSNYERNILKQQNLKKIMNDDNRDYEELSVKKIKTSKNSSKTAAY